MSWLTIRRGEAPLIVSVPHTGTAIPERFESSLVSVWRARKDTDWWIDRLYDFAEGLDATVVHTAISRTVIDVNRDPSGASLYPGQATTGLCPTTTFDGEPLYRDNVPNAAEIGERRQDYFVPYHEALAAEIARLRARHDHVVLYDCHSIRSVIPRLFEGTLPEMNIGTNGGQSCEPALSDAIASLAAASSFSHVVNGRFKGGWITRQYGKPGEGVHAVQMELACRSYMLEPVGPVGEDNWPAAYEAAYAEPMRGLLQRMLSACLQFAEARNTVRAKP
ncbi:MAG: N-formylglutamate deformylase [Pseudorhodoplanes sp.]|nr:N-formylglutamate deformylase [Pseudorhodoplanes sp.]